MKEKKVIDYTRTYRRIEADKKKCILYIVILILLGFLLMWTQIDDLTRMICKICAGVLKKYEPHMYVGIRSEIYPLFGKISYLSAGTVYPGIQLSLINTGISLGVIILLAGLPWRGMPVLYIYELKRHRGSAFHIVFISTGRTKTTVTAERNEFEIPAIGTVVHGTTKSRIAAVDHLIDIFHLSRSGMKSIFDFFIIVCKDSL